MRLVVRRGTMSDAVVFEVSRDEVANLVGRQLTDREWEVMSLEIENLLEHYTNTDVPILFNDIDELVAEDDKYREEHG